MSSSDMRLEVTWQLVLKKLAKWNSTVSLTYIRRYYQTVTAISLIGLLLIMSMLNLLRGKSHLVSVSADSIAESSVNFSSLSAKFDLPPPKPDAGLPINTDETSQSNKVIYNRIDKSGTRTFLYIIKKLALRNRFNHISSDIWAAKYTSNDQQKDMITEVNTSPSPLLYDRPVHYIHFPRYGASQPSWISLVRDPLERFVSLFYYKRYGDVRTRPKTFKNASISMVKHTFDDCVLKNRAECSTKNVMQIIPYFCGQGAGCRIPNRWALETAKRNIIDNFVVVGVLEELNTTLFVLQNVLPRFFKGAEDAYISLLLSGVVRGYSSFAGEVPSEAAMSKMKERLTLEYELYYFIKERLELMKQQFIVYPLQNTILVNSHSREESLTDEVNEDTHVTSEDDGDRETTPDDKGSDTHGNENGDGEKFSIVDEDDSKVDNLNTDSVNAAQDGDENEQAQTIDEE